MQFSRWFSKAVGRGNSSPQTLLTMIDRKRSSLLTIATTLLIFTSSGKGDYEQCVTSLRNTVVYEGTLDTTLSCTAGPNGTKWTVRPTSIASRLITITDYDDTVASTLTGLYALDPSGLRVRNATINATDGPISTAGFYTVEFPNTTNKIAAKLVVIRSGPICVCDQSDPTSVKITCNITYADHPIAPIYPNISCIIDGQIYTNSTFDQSSISTYVINYGLTITVNVTNPAAYDCTMTLSPPTYTALYPYVAKNAPDFSVTRAVCEQRTTTASVLTTTTTEPQTTTTATSLPLMTTPTTSITVSQKTTSSQETTTSKEKVLSIAVLLSVVFGALFLTAVVSCCWCYCFRQHPRFEFSEPIVEDYGFGRRGYIKRYAGDSFKPDRFYYREQPFY